MLSISIHDVVMRGNISSSWSISQAVCAPARDGNQKIILTVGEVSLIVRKWQPRFKAMAYKKEKEKRGRLKTILLH